jgi:hypothetical protein
MIKLPFVIEPRRKPILERIGSDESGYIEIERRGYLTSGEKAFVQQAVSSDEGTLRIIGLSRKVATSQSITLEEAYRSVIGVLGGSASDDPKLKAIEDEYFEEFNDVLNVLALMQSKEELITAVCMLRYRVDPDIDISSVLDLHPDIVSGLGRLYKDEESKSVERLILAEEASKQEETEGAADESAVDDQIDLDKMEKKQSRRTRESM